jgi:formyl-CoA transferase/CoA:oxalate CoA-transferase
MIAPYQAFATADGYVMVGAPSDAMWRRLTAALETPALADDPRFTDNPARVRYRSELIDALTAITRRFKTAELVERLRAAGLPCAPILTLDAVAREPQTRESGMLVGAPHPRLPDYRSVALPIEWDGRRPPVRRVPPTLGEHSADVLTGLGYTLDDVRGLRARKVIA